MIAEKGTALLEMIVVGFAVLLMVLPVIGTVARLSEASATVHAAARDGAVWVARHGGEPPPVDGVDLTVAESSGEIVVEASQEVSLIGMGGATVGRVVQSIVEVRVSEYRSSP